ncbi:MAG TPA: type II and III secretion system protein family protein [Xanthobacteraceae bacterium]|nr:type II and III secretion system protein family protein [Xanthobacteraceae bacterium]
MNVERRGGGLLAALAAAAIVTASLSPIAVGEAQAQRLLPISAKRSVSIGIPIGKTEDVRIDAPFTDITIGDSDVADVTPLTDRSLSILGKKIGTTRVSVYGEEKRLIGIFDVEVSYDISRLAAELRRMTGPGINVTSANGRIMLSGTAHDAPTLDRAVVIARQFAPDIINAVQVLAPQQVMLEVRFIEAQRQAGRALGIQWNSFGKNTLANIGNEVPARSLPVLPDAITSAGVLGTSAAPFGFLFGVMNKAGLSVNVAINALEEKGLIRSLAEPNLVALSGDTASFLAGGEFPILVPQSLGVVSVDYKKYGVGLAFTPTVLRDGVINLKIEPEVSELDQSHPVQISGYNIPPLIVRRASTTIELRDGQSFALGGLLQNKGTTAQEQLPWLGDVPVLGALFRSASYKKNETDLAIIVTPRIVRPARPGDPIKSPLDNRLPGNDVDLFLMGKPEVNPTDMLAASGRNGKLIGHMLDLPKGGGHVVSVKD